MSISFVKLEKIAIYNYKILKQVYEEDIMCGIQVFVGIMQFQDRREDIIDDERASCPTTSKTDPNMVKVTEMAINDQLDSSKNSRRTEHKQRICEIDSDKRSEHEDIVCQKFQ
jgi:hypothetical protein